MSAHHTDWPQPFLSEARQTPTLRLVGADEQPEPDWRITDEEFTLLVEGMWDAFWERIRKGDTDALAWTEQDAPDSPFIQWCNHGNGVQCIDPDVIRALARRVFRENEEKRLTTLSNIISFDTARARKEPRS